MSLSRTSLFSLVFGLAAVMAHAADPVTFHEISLLVRSGQTGQDIVNETARRKLLQPLTAQEEATLRSQGGSKSLVTALRTASLLATPEEVAAYASRRAPKAPKANPQPSPETDRPAGPMLLANHFPEGLAYAKKGNPRVMQITDAYRVSDLSAAMSRAQAERKPLGFIMVTGSMFAGKAYSSRLPSYGPGLVHFYEAFKDSLVLVFVREETELETIPSVVKTALQGPRSGGSAPNMAVTDTTATELVVEIPLGSARATGEERDVTFQDGASKIYEWLTYHPTARTLAAAPR